MEMGVCGHVEFNFLKKYISAFLDCMYYVQFKSTPRLITFHNIKLYSAVEFQLWVFFFQIWSLSANVNYSARETLASPDVAYLTF